MQACSLLCLVTPLSPIAFVENNIAGCGVNADANVLENQQLRLPSSTYFGGKVSNGYV